MKVHVHLEIEIDEDDWAQDAMIVAGKDWKVRTADDVRNWALQKLEAGPDDQPVVSRPVGLEGIKLCGYK
jgi:hypothetical protein